MSHFPRRIPVWADRREISGNESFNRGRGYISLEELSASVDSNREVCHIGILSGLTVNDYLGRNQFSKVVHDEAGIDLLVDVLRLLCVEVKETNGIFQLAERCFNAPSHSIELFQGIRWEIASRKVCYNGLKVAGRERETNNPKR